MLAFRIAGFPFALAALLALAGCTAGRGSDGDAPGEGPAIVTRSSTGSAGSDGRAPRYAAGNAKAGAGPSQGVAGQDVAGLTVTPTEGTAPLEVVFEATGDGTTWFGGAWLTFGDGAREQVCLPGSACRGGRVTHRYDAPGRYTATFAPASEGKAAPFGSVDVTVRP